MRCSARSRWSSNAAPASAARASLRFTRNARQLHANLPFDRVANLRAPFVEHRFVAAFEEQPRFGFGAGIAQEQSTALRFQFGFSFADQSHHAVEILKRF